MDNDSTPKAKLKKIYQSNTESRRLILKNRSRIFINLTQRISTKANITVTTRNNKTNRLSILWKEKDGLAFKT